MKAYEGRIYMGYGNWDVYPPVVVASYDPVGNAFHLEFSAYTDSIGIFREIGGVLYLPHTDPVHYEGFRDLSFRSEGRWYDITPVGMLHAFDVATVTGSDLWLVGSYVAGLAAPSTNAGATVIRSTDAGRTWANLTLPTSLGRYYYGFALRGRFYVRDTVYNGAVGSRVVQAPYNLLFKPTPLGPSASEFIVGLAERSPGLSSNAAPVTLVSYDTAAWRNLRSGVIDFTAHGSNVITLETNAVTLCNEIWIGTSVTATQAAWQRLDLTNIPPGAKALEALNGFVYVGDNQGRLWAGQLDGGAAPSGTPPAVINELSDGFGSALSLDANRLAVGASDHSGEAVMCGRVTVWERSPGGTNWIRTAVIDPPEPVFSGWFGKDVALQNNVLIVTEAGRDASRSSRGSSARVYLYEHTNGVWELRQVLEHAFTHSVALQSDTLVVGTSTSFHVYELGRNTTGPNAVLHSSVTPQTESSIYEPVGRVALDGNIIAFGQSGDPSRSGGPGQVSIFERTTTNSWVSRQTIRNGVGTSSRLAPDRLGYSLALTDGWLAIGAPGKDDAAPQAGVANLFEGSTVAGTNVFTQRNVTFPPIFQAEAGLGTSVALAYPFLLAGSPGTHLPGVREHGTVRLYERKGINIVYQGEIAAPAAATGEFGVRVAVNSKWIVAVARFSRDTSNLTDRLAVQRMPPDLFRAWSTANRLTGSEAEPLADPDADGANNLSEFAYNLNPRFVDANPVNPQSGVAGLPVAHVEQTPTGSVVRVTFLRRLDPQRYGLTYEPRISPDLNIWSVPDAPPFGTVLLPQPWVQWERVTCTLSAPDPASPNHGFFRVKVTHQWP